MLKTLEELYAEYVGEYPMRRGHGPWWVALLFNVAPKARAKTDIWMHSNMGLEIAVANHIERGFSLWKPAIEIGPFRSETAAWNFFKLWGENASKERGSRVLWALLLFNVYKDKQQIELNICNPSTLIMTENDVRQFAIDREESQREKRGRGNDLFTRRHRMWEMMDPKIRRITCADVRIRREYRQKRARNRKKSDGVTI